MYKAIFVAVLMAGSVLGQEPVENVKPLDWAQFQTTQEEIVKKQGIIIDKLEEIVQTNRQLNISILSWTNAKQEILQAVGNTGCDFWKVDENRQIKWVVVGFAVLGVFAIFHVVSNAFKKKETKTA